MALGKPEKDMGNRRSMLVACLSALEGTMRILAYASSCARDMSGEPESRIGSSMPSLVWKDRSDKFQRAVLALAWAPEEGSISLARSSWDQRVLMTAKADHRWKASSL